MADRSIADSRRALAMSAPQPPQIAKVAEAQGPDNPIPLSPQWLLPKPGENKSALITGDFLYSSHQGSRPDAIKALGNGEEAPDTEKKRDVFRPSVREPETGRRDRWRDEERDTNSSIRRDRWREGEKDLSDSHRAELWGDNSAKLGEARRVPPERWNDTSNREKNNELRRESKWNTRWGPDDKESDTRREKWSDFGRDGEVSREKGMTHVNNQGKDTEREGDHYSRPWRPNSSQPRGRGESLHHQTLTPNKQGSIFGSGRGRGEISTSVFSPGHGKFNSSASTMNSYASHSQSSGNTLDKSDVDRGDSSTLKYNRIKLLDIYRVTDVTNFRKPLDGFLEVPSLTQTEAVQPLAFSAPSSEELAILKGIDKGEIVSSGPPQVSKDGSVGRTSTDTASLRQMKPGSREDLLSSLDDYKDDNADKLRSYMEHMNALNSGALMSEGSSLKKADDVSVREGSFLERPSSQHTSPWRSQYVSEQMQGSLNDWNWSIQKEREFEQRNNMVVSPPQYTNQLHRQTSDTLLSESGSNSKFKRQPSGYLDREREPDILLGPDRTDGRRPPSYLSPEDMSLYYKDPQGQIQGPFSGADLIGWFEAGYFGIDLQVRPADAPPDAPLLSLGDIMPHLRMKARPPPGFNATKQLDFPDVPSREKLVGSGNIHPGFAEYEVANHGQRNRFKSATETENQFLESLMSARMTGPQHKSLSSFEGQAYAPPVGESAGDANYILSQRLSSERQRPLPNNPAYWGGRNAIPMASKAEITSDSAVPHSKIMPSMPDARQISQIPQNQNVDLLSILQKGAEKSATPAVSTVGPSWSHFSDSQLLNNSVHNGMDILQHKIDMHPTQHLTPQNAYGIQQQRLQQQNQPSLPHLIAQLGDYPSGFVPPEKLLSSGIPQDPQVLALLQQQYLLSQLQSQPSVSVPTQLSVLDKLLLLKQQQKQEQQLLLQQQHHMLSQVLSENQSHQHFGEPSYGHPQVPMSGGSVPGHHLGIQPPLGSFQIGSQVPVHNQHDLATTVQNFPTQVSKGVDSAASSRPLLLNLPHELFDQGTQAKEWVDLSQNAANAQNVDMPVEGIASTLLSEVNNLSLQEAVDSSKEDAVVEDSATPVLPDESKTGENFEVTAEKVTEDVSRNSGLLSSVCELQKDTKVSSKEGDDVVQVEVPSMEETKVVEGREVKKASDKKSKKQRNKAQSASEQGKGSSKEMLLQQLKQNIENDGAKSAVVVPEAKKDANDSLHGKYLKTDDIALSKPNVEADSLKVNTFSSKSVPGVKDETDERKAGQRDDSFIVSPNGQPSSHKAWKPAPGLKAKSLLEIQEEEQKRVQTEKAASEIGVSAPLTSSPTPWAGVVASLENKAHREVLHAGLNTQLVSANLENDTSKQNSRKSQLHDLLAEEVLAKSAEVLPGFLSNPDKDSRVSTMSIALSQPDTSAVEDDFVEAKDTKKNRKKAAKAKGIKTSVPVASPEISISPVLAEKGKSLRQTPQEELLPVPPAGPSLADFVPWKGEQVNMTPAAAWSSYSTKVQKPTSLRDILKEQEKKQPTIPQQIPVPTPAKEPSNRNSRGSGSLWSMPESSPSKGSFSIKSGTLVSTSSNSKIDDDLFWGPIDQAKQDSKQSAFPSLGTSNSWGTKSTPVKVPPVLTSNRQKPSGSKPDFSLSSSPANAGNALKGRRDTVNRNSEAMDFREWCESELFRLTGTRDTGFLEFCLKQSTSEAEMLLRENLGSLDPNHEFIDKVLNYKELLPSDVIEIAFQAHISRKVSTDRDGYEKIDVAATDTNPDTSVGLEGSKGGGKKKGKKGKKVSPSVLGFSVVSNRIMMGEIQTLED